MTNTFNLLCVLRVSTLVSVRSSPATVPRPDLLCLCLDDRPISDFQRLEGDRRYLSTSKANAPNPLCELRVFHQRLSSQMSGESQRSDDGNGDRLSGLSIEMKVIGHW